MKQTYQTELSGSSLLQKTILEEEARQVNKLLIQPRTTKPPLRPVASLPQTKLGIVELKIFVASLTIDFVSDRKKNLG